GRSGAVGGLLADLLLDDLLDEAPVAVERRNKLAVGGQRPARPRPRGAACILAHVVGVVLQRGEEILPFGIDRRRVVLVGGMQRLNVVGVTAIEEGSEGELVVGLILSCHFTVEAVASSPAACPRLRPRAFVARKAYFGAFRPATP